MHLPEQGGAAVLGRKIQQSGVGQSLGQGRQTGRRQRSGHAQQQCLLQLSRLRRPCLYPERQQQQGHEIALASAQAVHRLVIALKPTKLETAGGLETAPHRQQHRGTEQGQQDQGQGRIAQHLPPGGRTRRRNPPKSDRGIATRCAGQHQQIKLFESDPAAPGRKTDQRQQGQQQGRLRPVARGQAGCQQPGGNRQTCRQGMMRSQHDSRRCAEAGQHQGEFARSHPCCEFQVKLPALRGK